MGIKNRSDVGNSLFVQEAVFKALLMEYPDIFVNPLLELGPTFLAWNGTVIDDLGRQISQQLKALIEKAFQLEQNVFRKARRLEPKPLRPVFVTEERLGRLLRIAKGYGDITKESLNLALQRFPRELLLLHTDDTPLRVSFAAVVMVNSEPGDEIIQTAPYNPVHTYQKPLPPRAFDPATETQAEYMNYIKSYCQNATKDYTQHKHSDNLERDCTWAAWRMVEQLSTYQIAERWLERTGEEVQDSTVDQAIKRVMDRRKGFAV